MASAHASRELGKKGSSFCDDPGALSRTEAAQSSLTSIFHFGMLVTDLTKHSKKRYNCRIDIHYFDCYNILVLQYFDWCYNISIESLIPNRKQDSNSSLCYFHTLCPILRLES